MPADFADGKQKYREICDGNAVFKHSSDACCPSGKACFPQSDVITIGMEDNKIPRSNTARDVSCVGVGGDLDQKGSKTRFNAFPTTTFTKEDEGGRIEFTAEVNELMKMGWTDFEAEKALEVHGNNILSAAEMLAEEEEANLERFKTKLSKLKELGWDEESSLLALIATDGDVSIASEALEAEDETTLHNFESSVTSMMKEGWNGDVIKTALLQQWEKDIEFQVVERGKRGVERSRRQLKKAIEWSGLLPPPPLSKKVSSATTKAQQQKKKKKSSEPRKKTALPPRDTVKRECVVFNVTEKTLQKIVLESSVPVLLEVYADWCGPCKQLTPFLEESAIRGGGIFRLAKVDAEAQRPISRILGANAFPSVFAIVNGCIIDNFVGILDQDSMQAFMAGLVMSQTALGGCGTNITSESSIKEKNRREGQLSEAERKKMSFKIQQFAGSAELGVRKKEALIEKISAALQKIQVGYRVIVRNESNDSNLYIEKENIWPAVKLASTIFFNCINDISNPKYRRVSKEASAFTKAVECCPEVVNILHVAGFREIEKDSKHLVLLHHNVAVLSIVRDGCIQWLKKNKARSVF